MFSLGVEHVSIYLVLCIFCPGAEDAHWSCNWYFTSTSRAIGLSPLPVMQLVFHLYQSTGRAGWHFLPAVQLVFHLYPGPSQAGR